MPIFPIPPSLVTLSTNINSGSVKVARLSPHYYAVLSRASINLLSISFLQNLKLIGSLSGEVTMGVTGLWKLIDGAGKQVSIMISMLPMLDVDYVQKFWWIMKGSKTLAWSNKHLSNSLTRISTHLVLFNSSVIQSAYYKQHSFFILLLLVRVD